MPLNLHCNHCCSCLNDHLDDATIEKNFLHYLGYAFQRGGDLRIFAERLKSIKILHDNDNDNDSDSECVMLEYDAHIMKKMQIALKKFI